MERIFRRREVLDQKTLVASIWTLDTAFGHRDGVTKDWTRETYTLNVTFMLCIETSSESVASRSVLSAARAAASVFDSELKSDSVSVIAPTEWQTDLSLLAPDVVRGLKDAADGVSYSGGGKVSFTESLQRLVLIAQKLIERIETGETTEQLAITELRTRLNAPPEKMRPLRLS